ncbi:hypothetical protein BH760_gp42 [Gordonia phage Splinter]|uniref:Uncharacterized protein n=2 Tax=Vendettavirus vendetta TaxID=2049886 RepID=A0A160DCZ4_9CAUD|nr:hypothetical protein BH795_gp42 [Gordonia phage Vendetta]YP_009275423.1 hypothetical protein BH760_gp42 [Gordonia phage Splinter]ANA85616.1 hypothetical protein PBI_VENDETTA_69 [Gordonia phage Vendetta]ANA85695.1 hypothetical protein PBI_SPLINTER_69 [Gordonia phage Splinter]
MEGHVVGRGAQAGWRERVGVVERLDSEARTVRVHWLFEAGDEGDNGRREPKPIDSHGTVAVDALFHLHAIALDPRMKANLMQFAVHYSVSAMRDPLGEAPVGGSPF